jgi:Zn-dependent peptidase ImmA (M78 family)/DNA-binding XRE family transcriptional regulator
MDLDRKQLAEKLRGTRQTLGFTQAEVARMLDVHRPTISEIEAGRRAVTSEELYRFSKIYAVPLSALLGDPIMDEAEMERVLFRRDGVQTPTARVAVRRFMERCRSERELEGLLGVAATADTRPSYRTNMPTSPWDAVQQGWRMAEQERRRLGLGTEPLRNPLELLERQGVRVGPLEGVEQEQLDGVFFETDTLGACVAVNPSRDTWTGFRITFTVAHEYAHWLLRDVQAEPYTGQRFRKDLREARANAFAAGFLMPYEALVQYFTAAGLMRGDDTGIASLAPSDVVRAMDHFGVSRQALLFRLERLNLLNSEQAMQLRASNFSVTAVAHMLGLQLREQYNLGARLHGLAIKAWRRGLITSGRAADLLGLDVQTFKERMREIGEQVELTDDELLGAAAQN